MLNKQWRGSKILGYVCGISMVTILSVLSSMVGDFIVKTHLHQMQSVVFVVNGVIRDNFLYRVFWVNSCRAMKINHWIRRTNKSNKNDRRSINQVNYSFVFILSLIDLPFHRRMGVKLTQFLEQFHEWWIPETMIRINTLLLCVIPANVLLILINLYGFWREQRRGNAYNLRY